MEFIQARKKHFYPIIWCLNSNGLEFDHVKDFYRNFYVYEENGEIKAVGCYAPTNFEDAREVRSIVAPNGLLAKGINLFLCDKIMAEGCKKSYSIVEKSLEGYIEILKKHVGYKEIGIPEVIKIIPRYAKSGPEGYENKILLVKHL